MKLAVDSHTHTLSSAHAYSTVMELAKEAKEAGLEMLAITDHAPSLPDSCDKWHFINWHVCDRELYGVRMLYGVELNIMDYKGTVDLEENLLKLQDIVIASFHELITKPGTKKENTAAYLGAMKNPYVDIIGHPDDGRVPVYFEELVKAAKETGKLLELNNSSLKAAKHRLNCRENLITMLELCEKYQVTVSVGTDAHFATAAGRMEEINALLEEVHFPEELVANTSADKFLKYLHKFKA